MLSCHLFPISRIFKITGRQLSGASSFTLVSHRAEILSSRLGHSMWISWWTKRSLSRFFSGFLSVSTTTNFIPPFLQNTLWSRGNINASHTAGPGSIPGRVNILSEVFPGFYLNRKTMSGNLGHIRPRLSYDHHISSVYGRQRSLTIAVVHQSINQSINHSVLPKGRSFTENSAFSTLPSSQHSFSYLHTVHLS